MDFLLGSQSLNAMWVKAETEVMILQAEDAEASGISHWKLGEREGKDSTFTALKRNQPHLPLDFGLLASRIVR